MTYITNQYSTGTYCQCLAQYMKIMCCALHILMFDTFEMQWDRNCIDQGNTNLVCTCSMLIILMNDGNMNICTLHSWVSSSYHLALISSSWLHSYFSSFDISSTVTIACGEWGQPDFHEMFSIDRTWERNTWKYFWVCFGSPFGTNCFFLVLG